MGGRRCKPAWLYMLYGHLWDVLACYSAFTVLETINRIASPFPSIPTRVVLFISHAPKAWEAPSGCVPILLR